MKNLTLLLFIALIVISCGKEDKTSDPRHCSEVEYGSSFELEIGDEVCFPDGNSIIFINFEHLLCPCGTECVSPGTLRTTLSESTNNGVIYKEFYVTDDDRSVFDKHEISSFSYTYGSENEEVPPCAIDFEPEKIKLTLSISSI